MNRLRSHIIELARANGVTLLPCTWWRAYPYELLAEVGQVETHRHYCYALHEIGHCATARSLRLQGTYRMELAAWQWAKRNALVWTSAMEGEMRRFLAVYRNFCRQKL